MPRSIKVAIDDKIPTYDTYLTAEVASGSAALTVKNILNFAINQILLIGERGDENSEIIKTHASTAPTGSTITLAANLTKSHSPYTKVRVFLYDQIEFSHAVTSGGAKTVLATKDIQADAEDTRYDDPTYSSGYYFTRYKNSISGVFSDYSDPIPYSGFDQNTVSAVIEYSMNRNKMTDGFTENVNYKFCLDEINICLQEITGKMKGWTKLLKLNETIGHTARGINAIALPADIWENRGTKSITSVRIGDTELEYRIWSKFEEEMHGAINTQVRTQAVAGGITLEIDDSYDFAESGSINIYISGTLHTITYTGVTRSATAGVLTGIPASGDGSITVTIPVDTEIWQGESNGKSRYYSVDGNGYLRLWPLADATYHNKSIIADYYTGPTRVDSDADTLDVFRYTAVSFWLTWAIRMQIKNDGVRDLNDGDYTKYAQTVSDYIIAEIPAHRKKRGVKLNSIRYR